MSKYAVVKSVFSSKTLRVDRIEFPEIDPRGYVWATLTDPDAIPGGHTYTPEKHYLTDVEQEEYNALLVKIARRVFATQYEGSNRL